MQRMNFLPRQKVLMQIDIGFGTFDSFGFEMSKLKKIIENERSVLEL